MVKLLESTPPQLNNSCSVRKQESQTYSNQDIWSNSTVVCGKQLFIRIPLFGLEGRYIHINIRMTSTIIDLGKLIDAKWKFKKYILYKNGLSMSLLYSTK